MSRINRRFSDPKRSKTELRPGAGGEGGPVVTLLASLGFAIMLLTTPLHAEDAPIDHRQLLAFAPTPGDPALHHQRALFDQAQPAMTDRDLVLVPVIGPSDLRRRYHVTTPDFEAILIGKDGGAKYRAPTPIPAEKLIALIDAMPMRRQEMKSR